MVLPPVSQDYSIPKGIFPRVTHPSAARPEGLARLACVRPAASVRSEPGSNSQVESVETLSLTYEPCTSVTCQKAGNHLSIDITRVKPTNSEADTWIIGRNLPGRYASPSVEKRPDRPHIPSNIHQCQKAEETKSRKMRHSSDAPSGRSFPNCPEAPNHPARLSVPSSVPAFGEAVSRTNKQNPQAKKSKKMKEKCNQLKLKD